MKLKYTLIFAVLVAISLSSCGKPQTPQDVSKAFWQAVIEGNVDDVVEYSTLASEQGYEAFSRDWMNMTPSWGKVIIEENAARVQTHFSRPDAAQSEMLYFVTFLVRQNGDWKVDYDETEKAVLASSAVSDFVNRITEIGNEISSQIDKASNSVTAEIENLNDQLIQLTESLGKQATTAIQKYGIIMRDHLQTLSKSIENAIEEQDKNINSSDRKIMEETVKSLNENSKKLEQPDIDSLTETGEVIIITRKNLESIDAGTFQQYQDQWIKWISEVNDDLVNLLNEMSEKVN